MCGICEIYNIEVSTVVVCRVIFLMISVRVLYRKAYAGTSTCYNHFIPITTNSIVGVGERGAY